MITRFDTKQFGLDLKNILDYSEGFLEGVELGKTQFLKAFGHEIIDSLKTFIDSNAKVDPQLLRHVYEWYLNGDPKGRLFKLKCTVSGFGLSINSTFSQSKSIKEGSTVPFYDKANIMENGIPVTIKPSNMSVLAFEIGGQEIFDPSPVVVNNPGGPLAQGGYEHVFESFFNDYFSQSFLKSSGIIEYLQNPKDFKTNLPSAKRGGKTEGIATGYSWMIKARTLVKI